MRQQCTLAPQKANHISLPVPEGAYKKSGDGLFTRACSDRTRANSYELKED